MRFSVPSVCASVSDNSRLHGPWVFAGTWKSDLTEVDGKRFDDMLKWTIGPQVTGSWRAVVQGNLLPRGIAAGDHSII
jgi:hypothetical protein